MHRIRAGERAAQILTQAWYVDVVRIETSCGEAPANDANPERNARVDMESAAIGECCMVRSSVRPTSMSATIGSAIDASSINATKVSVVSNAAEYQSSICNQNFNLMCEECA